MEQIALLVLTVLVNGLVTWGVVKTELRYLRRDVDRAHDRADAHDERIRYLERAG